MVPHKTPLVETMVVNGAALVYMLRPETNKTFDEYAPIGFLPYICRQLELVNRIDVVCDVFIADSLKDALRGKVEEAFGDGFKFVILSQETDRFLRNGENKTELFKY